MILYTVIPCYNEEAVINETASRLRSKYTDLIKSGIIDSDSRILFVNDGSKDNTWKMISELHNTDYLCT